MARKYKEESKDINRRYFENKVKQDKNFINMVDKETEEVWKSVGGSQSLIGNAAEDPYALATLESAGNFLIKSMIGTSTNYCVKQLAISSFLANPSLAAKALYRLIGPVSVAAFCGETVGKYSIDVYSKNSIRNYIINDIIYNRPIR